MVESVRPIDEVLVDLENYWKPPMGRCLRLFAKQARGRNLRSRIEFARQCIILPEGPHKDYAWREEYQPFTGAVLKLMDESKLRKWRFSGCVQSGKSFIGVIVVLWHLLERGEDVGYAVPDLDQSARDKWQKEFLPVLNASSYLKQFLPGSGIGSQGGTPTSIKFTNGATLRFISGSGGDHHRSNFTVHCVFKTEVDRYDTATAASRETSPPEQIENRTEAHGELAWSYEECTVTSEDGRIWEEIKEGTNHGLHVQCCHCKKLVLPQREDYVGVEKCDTAVDAGENGRFQCPGCREPWTESERQRMISTLYAIPEGMTGRIVRKNLVLKGTPKKCTKGSVTWNAYHNRFWSTKKIGQDEWSALFSKKPTEMDLKRRQHAWTLPSEPEAYAVTPLAVVDIMERGGHKAVEDHWSNVIPLGHAPPGTIGITAGIDVGKRWLHFVVRAWFPWGRVLNSRVIDCGELRVESDRYGLKTALPEAVLKLDDRFNRGYEVWNDSKTPRMIPLLRGIDGGWQGKEIGRRQEDLVWMTLLQMEGIGRHGWLMVIGRGQSEPPGKGSYVHPKKVNKDDPNGAVWIGEQCHIRRNAKHLPAFKKAKAKNLAEYCILNTDEFKDILRTGYGDTPVGEDGAMQSFNATTKSERELLLKYCQQVIAEERESRYVQRRGRVTVFTNKSQRANHLGDADVYSIAMASVLEYPITLMPNVTNPLPPASSRTPMRTEGGQQYLATQRQG